MYSELIKKITDLPAIIQGALGSFLFVIVSYVVQTAIEKIRYLLGKSSEAFNQKRKLQEYIYRRFTSRSGLINPVHGYLFTLAQAFKGLLKGLLFSSVALLIGGSVPVVWGVCLAAAIYYFVEALSWLTPKSDWKSETLQKHWERVVVLEQELFGKVEEDTLEYLARNSPKLESVQTPEA